jgi:2-phospho-L-lactate/phosphoenolpyruvate guanylyltransferase
LIYSALVPVKSLAEAKSRLATYLTRTQRAALMLDMLHHVVCVLRKSAMLTNISIVSSDDHVLTQAHAWGVTALPEESTGHNPALTAAATRLLAAGTDALLTISADLPLLQPQHIQDMIEQSRRCDIVLAGSQDSTGTNAILTQPPLAVPYIFGINSFQHFQQEAQQRHLSTTTYMSLGTSLDIDTIDDITTFQQYNQKQPKMFFTSSYL